MNKYLLLIFMVFNQHSFAKGVSGDFDYYVLALSWSPQHCAKNPNDRQQCYRQLGFVLHGLWPQYNQGYPQHCSNKRMPIKLMQKFSDLYPNKKLILHEWRKHGTCSGLSPKGYLRKSEKLKNSLVIPQRYQQPQTPFRHTTAGLKSAFIKHNPEMTADNIAVYCSRNRRFLREIRICFDKTGETLQACSPKMLKKSQKQCGQQSFLVRNVR